MTIEVVVILSIIILAIIVYLTTYYLKKTHYTDIDRLDNKKKEVLDFLPSDKSEKLNKMTITGQSKAAADLAVKKVNEIEQTRLTEVEAVLFEAEQATDRYRFKQASTYQEKANAALLEIENDSKELISTIDELLQREEANLKKVDLIKKRYHKIRKELLTSSFTFGDSINSLEDKLGEVENKFTSFSDLTASGDHEEAKVIVNKLDKDISEMEELMARIPKVIKLINSDYVQQKEEIEEGYSTLIDQGYLFPETIGMEKEMDALDNEINQLKSYVERLEIKEADQKIEDVEQLINQLYDYMEVEIEAKSKVTKLVKKLKKIALHIHDQNREMSFEIDRINQSYTLYQNEEQSFKQLRTALNEQSTLINDIETKLSNNKIPYSTANDLLEESFEQLEKISDSFKELSQNLYSYREKEMEIKTDIEEMEYALREMKRYLESKHLPGLPKEYLNLFFYTTDHLESLSKELARPRLNLKEVMALHKMCEDDIENLAEQTDSIVDNALLTELTSQRLYRHREEHPEVIETIKYSELLFLEEYDFETALKMVREKLESIESGAYPELLDSYKKDKSYD
ncbi:septation ring formation regulator EzrA [Alkalibacterium olivapovliticus]|uniref:Septation ring formation regulator EzrA n=1 Tax=Alkalibacterium olivapovliticus TaxID=99907 RepID=A0A2T0WB53_9LACT|nr:septation ring formation regulator EzrA [Alkalibacterium olivapovliticus]PRY83931.1 septation ring formation regulator [Alkalibacterium olivapovliticus]